ncbi:uncharacterized protein LOC143197294 [Rhynchophorus ferrugineus]|uniref:uncharacterized protein LOC143197294 n=1 Tax=Rhynchophorus ferrugineus TaxID=354439 RepID=UPI003FCD670C
MNSVFIFACLLCLSNGYYCQRPNQFGLNILGIASTLQHLAGDVLSNLQQGNPITIEVASNLGNTNNQQNQMNQKYPLGPLMQGSFGKPNFANYNIPGATPGWPGYRPTGISGFGPSGFGQHPPGPPGPPGPPPGPPGFGPPGPPPGPPGFGPPGPPPGPPGFGPSGPPPGPPGFGPPSFGPPSGPPGPPGPPGYGPPGRPGFGPPPGPSQIYKPSPDQTTTQNSGSEKPNFSLPPGYPVSNDPDEEKDRQKIAGYIDGDFPVILLEENDIR